MLIDAWENIIIQFRQIKRHVLSLVHFYAFEDYKMNPVHFQRLIPPLQRLLKGRFFEDLRNVMKEEDQTEAQSLLELLSGLGEILKLANGYYLPLPPRCVELPVSKSLVVLSNPEGKSDKYYGCGNGYMEEGSHVPTLMIDEWMPSPTVNEFIETLKLQNPVKLNDEPTELFLPQKRRKWHPFQMNLASKSDCYIARYALKNSQPLYFWVENMGRGDARYYKIPEYYLETAKYALEYKAQVKTTIKCAKIREDVIYVRLFKKFPVFEQKMAMLFCFPLSFIKPIEWIVPLWHYSDFIWVLRRLGIDEDSIRWEGVEMG
ncbi:hypothetical protein [Geobacillus sp. Y412MC52]|uniref:hypothetical protein n=1 Tax=Geobacillus sp. (strain Y412MC52) TaxID=550542 RepID=UPI00018C1821|nr:hypothetical protein [Geobacillus sp. Y412MC52]ADU94760.1 hypothetical protein GYMC52_2373 [Geobacillus sp. Y412MC52]